jgi:simple sugar transport system substrate-binding protein
MTNWRQAVSACSIAVVLVLSGCNGSKEATENSDVKPVTVAYVCAETDIPFFAPLKQGAIDAAKAVGVNLKYSGISSTDISGPAMSKVMTAAINQKPDVLVACSFFPEVQRPLLTDAIDKGIPVYVVEGDDKDIGLGAKAAFGMDNETAGIRAGEELAKRAPGAKKVLCVNQLPDDPAVSARCVGLTKALSERGIVVNTLNLANATADQTRFVNGVQSALSTDKDINFVVTLGARQGEGAVIAAEAAGRADIKVATFDVSEQVLKNIEAGKTEFAVWQQPYVNGYLPVATAAMFVRFGMTPPGMVPTGPVFISKDNLSSVSATRKAGLL